MTHPQSDRLVKSLTDFWADMLGPDPEPPPAPPTLVARSQEPRPAAPPPGDPGLGPVKAPPRSEPRRLQTDPAAEARTLAGSSQSLDALREAIGRFEGCPLRAAARSTVVWDGAPSGAILVIDTGPGDDEDAAGAPLSGRSGRLFDQMLASIGLSRTRQVCVTGLVYWRRPGNRAPTAQEIEMCRPFLTRHIELQQPRAILTLGAFAARTLGAAGEDLMQDHGRLTSITLQGARSPISCIPLLHPAYLLRRPQDKEKAWRDMLKVADMCATLDIQRDRGL